MEQRIWLEDSCLKMFTRNCSDMLLTYKTCKIIYTSNIFFDYIRIKIWINDRTTSCEIIAFKWTLKSKLMKIGLRKWNNFGVRNFFGNFDSKNHAIDPEIRFLTKSISKPYGGAAPMLTAWELQGLFLIEKKTILVILFPFFDALTGINGDEISVLKRGEWD